MPERMKLTVLELRDLKSIGDKGAQKLEFKAKDGEREQWYFTFSKRLFPLVIKGQTLEADVETVVSVRGDNTYTDRKITEIYIAGQPSRLPQALTGVQMGFQKDTASIETQVAFKGLIELLVAGVVTLDSSFGHAATNWAMLRMGIVAFPEAQTQKALHELYDNERPPVEGSERRAEVKAPNVPRDRVTKTLSSSIEVPKEIATTSSTLLITAKQEIKIKELAKAKGAKTQEDIDQIKFDAGVRVTFLKELTAEEGDKLIAFLERMQGAK